MKTLRTSAGPLHGLRRHQQADHRRHEQHEVDDERQAQRRTGVVGEQTREQRPEPEAAEVDNHSDEARHPPAAARREVDEHRGRRAREHSG
jgi:hypothetical protein